MQDDINFALLEDEFLEPPDDERTFEICDECGCDIKYGDKYFVVFGKPLCEDCIEDCIRYAED